ncbi:DUF86 domain-containing protein [Candidatus Parcubacteria bacterium]|nr:DUF86 domain-containing protein [Candidatus Parcubacteria bacterium]
MKKDFKIFLAHIIESCNFVEKFIINVSKDEFKRNEEKQSAVIRKIEIIGEATKNLPLSFRKQHPQIDWKGAAGMRDVLIHDYFGVDLNLTWKVAQELASFKKQVEEVLDGLGGQRILDLNKK